MFVQFITRRLWIWIQITHSCRRTFARFDGQRAWDQDNYVIIINEGQDTGSFSRVSKKRRTSTPEEFLREKLTASGCYRASANSSHLETRFLQRENNNAVWKVKGFLTNRLRRIWQSFLFIDFMGTSECYSDDEVDLEWIANVGSLFNGKLFVERCSFGEMRWTGCWC